MQSLSKNLLAGLLLAAPLAVIADPSKAQDQKTPCTEDAMIVFDASGSMAGNLGQGIMTEKPRIHEVRKALARVLPGVTQYRKVGLITYGPGPYRQCNVQLDLRPIPDATDPIMSVVTGLNPAGKTPLTEAVEQAAEVLDHRAQPGIIVLLTDGEETCDGDPCALGKTLLREQLQSDRPRHRVSNEELYLDRRIECFGCEVSRQGNGRALYLGGKRGRLGESLSADPRLPYDVGIGATGALAQ